MRTANSYGVVDAIAEAVRQDGVVHVSVAALSLGAREVLVGGHPVAQFVGDRLEVAGASKLLGAEAFGQLASELRDVTLLGCLDEDPFTPSAFNLAAAARPRSGSRSTLDMCQRYVLDVPYWKGRTEHGRRAASAT